jgi:hypothetical protein
MSGVVHALACDGSGLYAGGGFITAGRVPASRIARWDPGTNTWRALGSGLSSTVYALAWDGAGLYAGGDFTTAGGAPGDHIARWDPATSTWRALGSGLSSTVYALAWDGGGLYAGGYFWTAGGMPANNIARWDPNTSAWTALGSGTSWIVDALAWDGGSLHAGGDFTIAGGKPSVHIARWSEAMPSDHIVGEGLGPTNGNTVRIIQPYGNPTSTSFTAYGAGRWGTNVAWGNIAGADAYGQILTGPGRGEVYGPHVRGFDRTGTPIATVSYYAYGTLRFGVNVGAAQLDVDPTHEILSGAGPGAVFGPHVRAWNYDGVAVSALQAVNYFAYSTLKYGVNVQGGNIDGDAWDEMLTGPGPGVMFGPHVRCWNYDGGTLSAMTKINFNAYTTTGYGVNVAGGDVERDGYAEIATARGPDPARGAQFVGFNYDGSAITAISGFAVDPFSSLYGGRVALADLTGDLACDLIAAPGRDPSAAARVISYSFRAGSLQSIADFAPFTSMYGVNVAGGPLGY